MTTMTRLMQIVPVGKFRLYGEIVKKEVDLAKRNRGTFYRSGPKVKDRAKWSHQKYKGWINLQRGAGEIVTAEVVYKGGSAGEWQLLHAFIGWIDRHFGDRILAINVQYAHES